MNNTLDMQALLRRYQSGKSDLDRRRANQVAVAGLISTEEDKLASYTAGVEGLSSSVAVVQNFSNNMRTDIISKFEDLLTSGVREIFDKDYKLKIELSASGNSYHADFFVVLADGKKINLATGEGGGLRDFVSVLQRILYIMLEPSQPAKIVFMDESLKALDSDRAIKAFRFIAGLCKELGVQLVCITHSQAAKAMSGFDGVSVLEVSSDGTQSNVKVAGV